MSVAGSLNGVFIYTHFQPQRENFFRMFFFCLTETGGWIRVSTGNFQFPEKADYAIR